MSRYWGLALTLVFAFSPSSVAEAATLYSQTVILTPGWNVVSTPRALDSHSFSIDETSNNFDIYVLDASQTSGWATMAQVGQTEFTPLWGYFVDNKTGVTQTLTFNYKADTQPNERLFERTFSSPGWYSIGVANATYALPMNAASSTDTDNPSSILTAVAGKYDTALDLTDGAASSDIRSVSVSSGWAARIPTDVDTLHDFRETKGYALHVTTVGAQYDGFQNASETTYALSYSAGTHGSISGTDSQIVVSGEDGTAVTAVPDSGYEFSSWSDGVTDNPRTDTDVASDVTVTATFTLIPEPGALSISASTNPASQSVVAGGQNVVFANIQLDASQSGEDIRLSTLPIRETGNGYVANLNSCQLWDGSTSLTTGSNVVNSVNYNTATTFAFDNALTVPKGTVKTLAVGCNLSSSATSSQTYIFGVNSGDTFTPTGVQSGNSVSGANLTVTTSSSGTMTVSTGASVTVSVDSSSPSYAVNAGGTTGVVAGVIKLRASNENFNLTKLGLDLSNGSYAAKSTGSGAQAYGSADLTTVYLYNSSGTLLGTATFTGTNTSATSTLSSPLLLTRDVDTTITVKVDLAGIGSSASGGIGNLVKVDPLNFEGTGVASGSTLRGGATAGAAGVRLFKSYPTLALDALGSTGMADGKLIRFKVTANSAGSIGVKQFAFKVSTTTATVTAINLYGYTDSSYSQAVSGQGSGGQIGSQVASADNGVAFTFIPSNPVQVPAGQTYYFELRAAVAGVTTGASVVTTFLGDAAYSTLNDVNYNVATSSALTASNFIWSGNSTTTATASDVDWSNGYGLSGLPSSGLVQVRAN